jgi:hypothetical protein
VKRRDAKTVDWGAPMALGLLTASGLLSALVADGIGDVWSWFCLAMPLVVAAYCIWRRVDVETS